MLKRILIPLLLLVGFQMMAQVPFNCNGRIFRISTKGGGSVLEEIYKNDLNNSITFEDRRYYNGMNINGLAYHPSQNLIYGINYDYEEVYQLVRIDGEYNVEILREVDLPSTHIFVSGDISPDERYHVLLGYSSSIPTNILVLIDVTQPNFPVSILPMRTTNPEFPYVFCADIAFHPTTDKLYGYDHHSHRMITIDINNQIIDNSSYPEIEEPQADVPSIFFDAYGKLFGIGTPEESLTPIRKFYAFNIDNGEAVGLLSFEYRGNQDACSCPYQFKLLNKVNHRKAAKCSELEFTITLINRTDSPQNDLFLTDTFPEFSKILSVDITGSPDKDYTIEENRIFNMEIPELPVGNMEVKIVLDLPESIPSGNYENFAYLYLDANIHDINIIPSDDPDTPVPDDATRFEIDKLYVDFENQIDVICKDQTLELIPNVAIATDFLWSTGEKTSRITVSEPGLYAVTVSTSCEENSSDILISEEEISLELGEGGIVEVGTEFKLMPEIYSDSEVTYFFWDESPGKSIHCAVCLELIASPRTETEYQLFIENESGCSASDKVVVQITDHDIYMPNIFSPNGDGINDVFFIQSKNDYYITYLRIYDRWGNLVFSDENEFSNNNQFGWDGQFKGQDAPQGTYAWTANLFTLAGTEINLTGDITLVR